ncbi:MAG TPA: hypothetical protein VFJ77_12050 [Gaiellaceae bacterium]|nr:hypothetical protein [Gaiellaceae bacterium]
MSAYRTATLEEMTSTAWPHWVGIRHHFDIQTFGINAWHGREDGTVIPEHDEGDGGEPELYWVVSGHATFTVSGEEIDAPAGTFVWVTHSSARRAARANAAGTLVLAVSAGAPGEIYAPDGWDSEYLD